MFLVLDALDECTREQRAELCEFFCEIIELSAAPNSALSTHSTPASKIGYNVGNTQSARTSLGSIKLFVTSRKESDIERVFRQRSFPKVEIEAERVDHDIAIYVKAQLEQRIQDERLILRKQVLQDKILTTLTTKARGMCVFPK